MAIPPFDNMPSIFWTDFQKTWEKSLGSALETSLIEEARCGQLHKRGRIAEARKKRG
jgi:hypothetical protein